MFHAIKPLLVFRFVFISFIALNPALSQDTLITIQGVIVIGTLTEIEDDYVWFQGNNYRSAQRIPVSHLGRISTQLGKVYNFSPIMSSIEVADGEQISPSLDPADAAAANSLLNRQIMNEILGPQPSHSNIKIPAQPSSVQSIGLDTLVTKSGFTVIGEVINFDEKQIVFSPEQSSYGNRKILLTDIEKLSTRPWTILTLGGSIVSGNISSINSRILSYNSGSGTPDSVTISNIGAIYNLRSSPSKKSTGAAYGVLAGALVGSIPVLIDLVADESSPLFILTPVALIGGGFWGSKRWSHNFELQGLYVNPMLIETFDFKNGMRDGRRSSLGNISWFFKGLALSIVAPINAIRYKPVPALHEVYGKSCAYAVGYIEGYGNAASSWNLVYSTTGAVGNGFGAFIGLFMYAVATSDTWTN